MSDREGLYKDTLNLPKTEFPMRANLATRELELLAKWKKNNLYEKILAKNKNNTPFILHDGPPYANGMIHVGHAVNKTLKDITLKYKAMQGFYTPLTPGWDCHGLPIELQAIKKIKEKHPSKNTVREKCREHAKHFIEEQKKDFKRLLLLGDFDHPYETLDFHYESDILESLLEVFKKGYVYRGLRPVHWCVSCGSALADAEIEYAQHKSSSLYVKFPVENKKSVLIWTTTPWSLPGNVALAFHKDIVYVEAYSKADDHTYIMAKDLLAKVMSETKNELMIKKELSLSEIENLEAKHPFIDRKAHIVFADHVTLEAGTGVVHTAPAHGEEDFKVCQEYAIDLIMPVDAWGRFTKEAPEELVSQKVFKASSAIIEILEREENLFYADELEHSYPHCWRCKNPVITRTTPQWFLNLSHNHLLKRAKETVLNDIEFIPKDRQKRMLTLLESRPDWCISRQRIWGVPIPALECSSCGDVFLNQQVMEYMVDRSKNEGFDFWFDMEIDTKTLFPFLTQCPSCGDKEASFTRGGDILDVWFDSSISWYHLSKKLGVEGEFQSDLYLEGSDQFRAWFQVSLLTSLMLQDKGSYKRLLSHGFVLDDKGRAMSKSIGNTVSPVDIMNNYGADILRLWIVSQNYSEDMRVGDALIKQIADSYRKIRNTFRFLLSNLYDYNVAVDEGVNDLEQVDKWILYKLALLTENVHQAYEKMEFHEVFKQVYYFMNLDLSSFYLDILKDSLYTEAPDSKRRRSSQKAFSILTKNLATLLAPVLPFTSEEVFSFLPHLKTQEESVFLTEFPKNLQIDFADYQDDFKTVEKIKQIRDEVLKALEKARTSQFIGSNLESLVVLKVSEDSLYDFLKKQEESLAFYFIVSQVQIVKEIDKSALIVYKSEEIKEIEILVFEALGKKCSRCWKYFENIEDICTSCESVLKVK